MALINPHINFNGNCEEAFKAYERILGGKIEGMHTFAGMPDDGKFPADWKNKIMHVSMTVHGQTLMGSDAPPGHFQKPQGLWVSLNVTSTPEAERIFKELAAGGTTIMPIQQTFWAERFGMLIDAFGTPWMVNCHKAA